MAATVLRGWHALRVHINATDRIPEEGWQHHDTLNKRNVQLVCCATTRIQHHTCASRAEPDRQYRLCCELDVSLFLIAHVVARNHAPLEVGTRPHLHCAHLARRARRLSATALIR